MRLTPRASPSRLAASRTRPGGGAGQGQGPGGTARGCGRMRTMQPSRQGQGRRTHPANRPGEPTIGQAKDRTSTGQIQRADQANRPANRTRAHSGQATGGCMTGQRTNGPGERPGRGRTGWQYTTGSTQPGHGRWAIATHPGPGGCAGAMMQKCGEMR